MRPFLARFSESVWSGHLPSWADFITTTPVFRFSVHTAVEIEGLQVRDGRKFRSVGISNLFAAIDRELRDRSPDEVRLNATGGFKGTVPYLVLYGMFHELPVSYVNEFSNTLMTLPPFAVTFDWERIAPAEQALLTVFKAGALDEATWRDLLPADYLANPDRYDPLFEHDDGHVGLSAIGYLMKARLDAAETEADVLLSPQARAALAASGGTVRLHLEAMLTRVRNPLHRGGPNHAESLRKSDLKVWKVYATTGPRMLYWLDAGRVLVGELLADHDQYLRYVDGDPLQRRDYGVADFVKLELAAAAPDYDAVLADIRQARAEPFDRIGALDEQLRNAGLELQRERTGRNAALKRAREQAELRGHARGEKAERGRADEELALKETQKEAMRQAYRAELDRRDEEIERLKDTFVRLETELALARTSRDHDDRTV